MRERRDRRERRERERGEREREREERERGKRDKGNKSIRFSFFLSAGVSTTEGEHWERQRNFFHDHLTDLVDGKGAKGFHEVIMDEIQDMKRSLTAKVKHEMREFAKI